jgi:hypothetical protein
MSRFVLACMLLALPVAALAQETSGDIRGRLAGPSGPVADAVITATSPDLLGSRRTLSASDGVFLFIGLPPGTYALRIQRIGYRPVIVEDVPVRLGRTTGLAAVELEPMTAQIEALTITAPRVSIDPVRTSMGATLDAADLATLPGDRDYRSLLAILPHVNTSYNGDPVNAGGATGLENMFFIDGVNVTSLLHASRSTSLPANFVRTVEVRTGGYEAQYGRALGAIVNAVTYTGTNAFEAGVFGYFTHSALAATPRAEPALRQTGAWSYDVGARVSGPVLRDRLWFSAAYNPRVDHADVVVGALGTFVDRRRADVFAAKLTWRATPASNVELSVFGDPTTHHAIEPYIPGFTPLNVDPFLRHRETGGTATSLRLTRTLGASSLLEASLSRSSARESHRAATQRGLTEVTYVDFLAGTVEGGSAYPVAVTQGRTSLSVRATLARGRHTVVAGGDYEVGRVTRASGSGNGNVPGAVLPVERRDSNVYFEDEQFVQGTFRTLLPTAYLQDAWRATDRLTVNAGLRWSKQTLTGASGARDQVFADEWQPRVGVSLLIGAGGRQRLFGSLGRFYQQVPLNLASIFFADSPVLQRYYAADPRTSSAAPFHTDDFTTHEADFRGVANGLSAEHFDEMTVGYERLLSGRTRLTLRAVRRHLRSAFLMAYDPINAVLGTPGKGDMTFLPAARREYTALELTLDGTVARIAYRASYVLSRSWGNYTGLHGSDSYFVNPGINNGFALPDQAVNSTGWLPNDRPHVVKVAGSWAAFAGFTVGSFVTLQSGTPLNDFGAGAYGPFAPNFLAPRGSKGRLPALADVSVRVSYDLPWRNRSARCVLDVQHLDNRRRAVRSDQLRYFALDSLGAPVSPNPNFGKPLAFQAPLSARVGVEIGF